MKETLTSEASTTSNGLNKKTAKKLLKWEGWKKEIIWIIIFAFFLLMVYAYYNETKVCQQMKETRCFQECDFAEKIPSIISKWEEEHPGTTISCSLETLSCTVFGVEGLQDKVDFGGHNITIGE